MAINGKYGHLDMGPKFCVTCSTPGCRHPNMPNQSPYKGIAIALTEVIKCKKCKKKLRVKESDFGHIRLREIFLITIARLEQEGAGKMRRRTREIIKKLRHICPKELHTLEGSILTHKNDTH